ncbi:MAG: RNHCP domain-containing protein [Patescibacteria group bacterium]
MSTKFIKKKENFICEHCGREVKGTGYTNHCPNCLWSKHVDVSPGDRAEECGGLMKPVDFYLKKQEWVVVHECEKCGERRRNVLSDEDNFDEAVRLKKEINDKVIKKSV